MTLRCKLYGIVQGVSLRYNIMLKANELGLKGWVKNNEDGTVSVEVCGDKNSLSEFKFWLEKSPGFSRIEKIKEEWFKEDREYKDFKIIY